LLVRRETLWDWNAGNLVHCGHVTLGRLALLAGDVEPAEEHARAV
jgi:hypothetical protein